MSKNVVEAEAARTRMLTPIRSSSHTHARTHKYVMLIAFARRFSYVTLYANCLSC
jgi:hypothetical protein